MKKILLSISFVFITAISFGQFQWEISFDNNYYLDRVYNDTVSNPNCIWQVGHPNKTIFTSAYSIPNSMVTDTLNSVPPNDTSTFYLIHERDNTQPFHIFLLNFWFQMDGDSTDYGTIEISPDNQETWINMLNQDTAYDFIWYESKPTLKGTTNGWQHFDVNMHAWASGWGTFPVAMTADTIFFRFTYVSDSNATAHDSWIIDDIRIDDWWDGINEIQNNNLITICPNPAADKLTILRENNFANQTIQIRNITGQVLYTNQNFTGETINIRHLDNGVYFLKYSDTKSFAIKKFVVNH